jgi:dihydroanticapsin dehydrogenase
MTKPYLSTESDRDMARSEHPIGRIGTPEDVAKAILYFASDDSSWATGAVLPLDGGAAAR